MKKTGVIIRVLVYCVIVGGIIMMIRIKQEAIIRARNMEVMSIGGEWEKHGKPVTVLKVRRKNFYSFTKITAQRQQGTLFTSYVSQEDKEKIAVGQNVYYEANTNILCGSIIAMSDKRDFDTGLFEITMDLNQSTQPLNHREIVFVHTGTIPDVLQLTYTAVDLIDQKILVRVLRDGHVDVVTIESGMLDREALEVTQGLQEGDRVIIEGKSLVEEGDKVFVGKEINQ